MRGVDIAALPLADMREVDARIHEGVLTVLSVADSVTSRRSFGGTAPECVRREVEYWTEPCPAHGRPAAGPALTDSATGAGADGPLAVAAVRRTMRGVTFR